MATPLTVLSRAHFGFPNDICFLMSFALAFAENCTQMMTYMNIETRFYYDYDLLSPFATAFAAQP